VAIAFGVALLASGLAASGVGTLAGDVVMQGFVRRRIPVPLRRALTLAPALLVLCLPGTTTQALVISQVVLSFGVPFATFPLIRLTADRTVMGAAVNRWWTTAAALLVSALICGLNVLVIGSLLAA
jgi:manganese transport protein